MISMNRGLWVARKNYLYTLIKKVSDGFGDDDSDFLKQHFNEVVDVHPGEKIEEAILCYEEMVKRLKHR